MPGVMNINGISEKQKPLRGELHNANDRELVTQLRHAESQLVPTSLPVRQSPVTLARSLHGE
jgi:hypothetical protein